jgi:exonuclease VII small subunit
MPETATAAAIPISENEAVKNILTLLQDRGAEREKQDIESLVKHMESMETQFGKVLSELENVQAQLKTLQDKGLRASMTRLHDSVCVKVNEAKAQFAAVKNSVFKSFSDAAGAVKKKGVSALNKTVNFLKIRSALTLLKNKLDQSVESLHNGVGQIQKAKTELHTAKEHAANAARLFVGKKAKETTRANSDRGILSAIQRAMLKTGSMLAGMSKAADAAVGKLEQLDSKNEKPSVSNNLKTIRHKQNEVRSHKEKALPDKAR